MSQAWPLLRGLIECTKQYLVLLSDYICNTGRWSCYNTLHYK